MSPSVSGRLDASEAGKIICEERTHVEVLKINDEKTPDPLAFFLCNIFLIFVSFIGIALYLFMCISSSLSFMTCFLEMFEPFQAKLKALYKYKSGMHDGVCRYRL